MSQCLLTVKVLPSQKIEERKVKLLFICGLVKTMLRQANVIPHFLMNFSVTFLTAKYQLFGGSRVVAQGLPTNCNCAIQSLPVQTVLVLRESSVPQPSTCWWNVHKPTLTLLCSLSWRLYDVLGVVLGSAPYACAQLHVIRTCLNWSLPAMWSHLKILTVCKCP